MERQTMKVGFVSYNRADKQGEHVIFAMSNYTQKLHNSCEPISPLR